MDLRVVSTGGRHRLDGDGACCELASAYLSHLAVRNFSSCTGRSYAFDRLHFGQFIHERGSGIRDAVPADLFDWLDWQARKPKCTGKVVG